MRIIAALLFSLLLCTAAFAAQCDGSFGVNQVCGSVVGGPPGPVNSNSFPGGAGGTNAQIQYNNSGPLGGISNWTSDGSNLLGASAGIINWNSDTILLRDAAEVVGIRNGLNATGLHVYNTYTSGTNFESGIFDWTTNTNVLTIGTQKGSSGNTRNLEFVIGGTNQLDFGISAPNQWTFGTTIATAANLNLASNSNINWNSDTFLTRIAAASLQLGAANSGTPVAQTLRTQSGSGTNIAGQNWTAIGSLSTGTATDGDIIFQTGVKNGVSGSGAATPTTALTLKGETQQVQIATGYTVAGGSAMTANQGTGASVQHSTGSTTTNNTVKFDANGNTVDNGVPLSAGQVVGTATNDNANAGNIGEYVETQCPVQNSTVTITIASPAVVTYTAHGLIGACPIVFTTTGALPTGITSGTTYYIVPSSVTTNTFQIATTLANALAGTSVNTSGSQSGTQTGTINVGLTTATPTNITAISLTAGDWDVSGSVYANPGTGESMTTFVGWVSSASATLPTEPNDGGAFSFNVPFATSTGQVMPTGTKRFSLSGTTTIYLSTYQSFSGGTDAANGVIRARRMR